MIIILNITLKGLSFFFNFSALKLRTVQHSQCDPFFRPRITSRYWKCDSNSLCTDLRV